VRAVDGHEAYSALSPGAWWRLGNGED